MPVAVAKDEEAGPAGVTPGSTRDVGVRRLQSVDALRGIAVLIVVLTHIPRDHQGRVDGAFFALLPLDFGTLGVPLFLVISGFCIHMAVARRTLAGGKLGLDWAAFWRRRFYRLYPPYLAAIVLALVAYVLLDQFDSVRPDRHIAALSPDLMAHLLLVHNILPAYSGGLFNPAFWTLALEEQLYAFFALLLALRRRVPIFTVLWISLAVSLLWRSGVVWTQFLLVRFAHIPREAQVVTVGGLPAIGEWTNWPFAWWFLWVLGAVAAEGYTRAITLPAWCYSRAVAVVAMLVCVATYFRTLGRYTEFWLTDSGAGGWLRAGLNTLGGLSEPAFGVVCFVVLNRWSRAERAGQLTQRWVTLLGSVGLFSYSLYLVHQPTIAILEAFLPLGPREAFIATIARVCVYVPVSLAVAYAFFLGVERRFLRHRPG